MRSRPLTAAALLTGLLASTTSAPAQTRGGFSEPYRPQTAPMRGRVVPAGAVADEGFPAQGYLQAPIYHPSAPGVYPAAAQDDGLDDLRARIEALERQNEQLRSRLEENGGGRERTARGSEEVGPGAGEAQSGGVGADGPGTTQTPGSEDGKDEEDWYEIGSDLEMHADWHNGLELISKNKDFRVHVGGRTQIDGVWFDESPAFTGAGGLGDQDAVFFRRARLRVDGTMYEWIDWAAEYDLVNSVNENQGLQGASEVNVVNVPAPTDLWFNFKGVPYVGNVRIGNMKEPIGMEHLTSSRFLPFMERSFNQDVFYGAFNNGFTPGIMLWNTYGEQRGTWATGVFKNTFNPFAYNVGDGEYAWTSRVTYLPWYDEASAGRGLWHLGVAGSVRDTDSTGLRYRARPSLRNGPGPLNPVLVDTGTFPADDYEFLGFETAFNYGPLNVQAEWTGSFAQDSVGIRGPAAGDPLGTTFYHGWYVQVLWFLTGEHMPYDRQTGVFTRVVPFENAFALGSPCGNVFTRGAWQVGARYDYIDLRDEGIDGGIAHDVTTGLNWYLNPNMHIQWNYVYTRREAGLGLGEDGNIHGAGVRLAHDF